MNSLFANPAGTRQHVGARVAGVALCSACLLLAGLCPGAPWTRLRPPW